MWRAVGIDEDSVGDLLDLFVALRRMRGPARDAVNQRGGNVVGIDGVVAEGPQRVFGAGLVGRFAVFDPVDGAEDDEWMRPVEVDPQHAARRAETEDTAGDGEIAVFVGKNLVGDGEEVERRVSEWFVAGFG